MAITTIRHEQLNTGYGGFYCSDNSTVSVIDTQNIYHPLFGVCSVGLTNQFTFVSGEENNITAVANGGGGTIKVTTANPHGYSANDYVTIVGTTNYNGNFQVVSLGNSSEYYIVHAFTSTQTGRSIRGDRLVCGKAGIYKISAAFSCTPVGNSKTFAFSLINDIIVSTKAKILALFATTDRDGMALTSLETISSGSWIRFVIQNQTDTTDITINDINFNITEV